MAQIFISYSRADRHFVDQFIHVVRRVYGQSRIWFDADIHGGVNWWQMILDEIGKSDLFIFLISAESLESPYCQAELKEALRLKKQILPVIVRRLKTPYPGNIEPKLATKLRETQFVDLSGGFRDSDATTDLHAAINRLLYTNPQDAEKPVTYQPTPQPSVTDKVAPANRNRAYIGGGFVLLAVVIVGMLVLSQMNSGGGNFGTSISPTIAVTAVDTDAPTSPPQPTNSPTVIPTQRPTATPTQTPTDTPTATQTLPPEQLALTPVASNDDWAPYERDFDGVTMVLVPAGCYMMGGEQAGSSPAHEQCFDEPFWIDKYEVTNEQYGSLGCEDLSSDPDQPRNCVSWLGARNFCAAREVRLPTEAEWEYAARGPSALEYAWGDEYIPGMVVYYSPNSGPEHVGSRPANVSWVGALDMTGNLWEWTNTFYKEYPYSGDEGREAYYGSNNRVVRGGSYSSLLSQLRAETRVASDGPNIRSNLGFRCARDFDASE